MLGAGVVGLGGYYIWKSGGSPSAAEKKFEGTHPHPHLHLHASGATYL